MSAAYKRASTLMGLPDLDRGWEEVQAKTFMKCSPADGLDSLFRLNTKLALRDVPPMTSLVRDLADGVLLIQLMEIMGGVSLGRYYKSPRMRVQMAENVNKALDFIKSRGVVLTNCGAEDVLDGNGKIILGLIWTLILRFTIADISEEGVTAKEGLLLWCQRKTAPYRPEVEVHNFSTSWKDGLALCALIHRHRPDLLDYASLPKTDAHACTRIAFQTASQHLGIPQLLDVEDLCERAKPDEKSVMTYVAQYFHAFSSMEQAEAVSRRVATFADVMQSAWSMQNDYERRARELLAQMSQIKQSWQTGTLEGSYAAARKELTLFNGYKQGLKRRWVQERTDLAALLGNIQTKLKTYHLREWVPAPGLRQLDIDAEWEQLAAAEAMRSRAINAEIRNAKEKLRVEFAELANSFERELRSVTASLSALDPLELEEQRAEVERMLVQALPPIKASLAEIEKVDRECQEANVEENDHTIFTLDDLLFELELVSASVTKKLAFIENQAVSRQHTHLTPAQLEEFESTFRFFDKDGTNTLTVPELGGALASLGIIYSDEDTEQIHMQLLSNFGSVSYDAFLTFLREIIEDTTSPDQLLEAFQGLAGEKPFVTEVDLRQALLPQGSIDYLKQTMPHAQHASQNGGAEVEAQDAKYDYHAYIAGLFTPSLQ